MGEIQDMKRKAVSNAKLMHDISQENKRLSEPLTVAIKEVESLKHELKDQEKDKLSLRNAKSRTLLLQQQKRELEKKHSQLLVDTEKMEKRRDELQSKFEGTVLKVQRHSDFKNLLLEQRLSRMNDEYAKKQAQLSDILQAAHLDPHEVQRVTASLEEVLAGRNQLIRDLGYNVAKSSKAYNDSLNTYLAKMTEFGIPEDEIRGFAQSYPPLLTK